MADQIALVQVPVYETTGTPGPRVLHDLSRFEILGTLCHVRTNAEGDMLDLTIGRRRFAISLLDLSATAALSIEAHLRSEIRNRVIASGVPCRTPRPHDSEAALTDHLFGCAARSH